jgi:uncharacterized protein YjdB
MPGQINLDTQNEQVSVGFVDAHGNDAPEPANTQVTFTSSDPSVATVTPAADHPLIGNVQPLADGTTQIGVTFNGTALEPDGTTPIPDPDPVTVQVNPGGAVGARLSLSV